MRDLFKEIRYVSGKTGGTWKCTAKCKALTQFEVDTVLEFKSYFEKSLHDVMTLLSMCDDDCPNTHHSKICNINESDVQRKGHSVLCYDGSECKSRLRILRLASCHYPVLRGFLNNVSSLSNAIATPALFSLDCRTTPSVLLLLEENNLGSCFYHRYTKVKVCQERSQFFGGV